MPQRKTVHVLGAHPRPGHGGPSEIGPLQQIMVQNQGLPREMPSPTFPDAMVAKIADPILERLRRDNLTNVILSGPPGTCGKCMGVVVKKFQVSGPHHISECADVPIQKPHRSDSVFLRAVPGVNAIFATPELGFGQVWRKDGRDWYIIVTYICCTTCHPNEFIEVPGSRRRRLFCRWRQMTMTLTSTEMHLVELIKVPQAASR